MDSPILLCYNWKEVQQFFVSVVKISFDIEISNDRIDWPKDIAFAEYTVWCTVRLHTISTAHRYALPTSPSSSQPLMSVAIAGVAVAVVVVVIGIAATHQNKRFSYSISMWTNSFSRYSLVSMDVQDTHRSCSTITTF